MHGTPVSSASATTPLLPARETFQSVCRRRRAEAICSLPSSKRNNELTNRLSAEPVSASARAHRSSDRSSARSKFKVALSSAAILNMVWVRWSSLSLFSLSTGVWLHCSSRAILLTFSIGNPMIIAARINTPPNIPAGINARKLPPPRMTLITADPAMPRPVVASMFGNPAAIPTLSGPTNKLHHRGLH